MNQDARVAIISLLKGIFYKEENQKAFFELLEGSRYVIQEYFQMIGLEVVVYEEDGFAYLQNIEQQEDQTPLPKLISKRALSYKVSLLCVLLRQKLAQFEAQSEDERAILTQEDIVSMLQLFLEIKFNEIKVQKEIEALIKKVEDLGFLKKLRGEELLYEIKPALKAFVDAQWLSDFDAKLKAYQEAQQWS